MIYQHEARGADKAITSAINAHVEAERGREGGSNDGPGGMLVPTGLWHVNGTRSCRRVNRSAQARTG